MSRDDLSLLVDMRVDPSLPLITHHHVRDLALRLTARTRSLSFSTTPSRHPPEALYFLPTINLTATCPFPDFGPNPDNDVITVDDASHSTPILLYSGSRATFSCPCVPF